MSPNGIGRFELNAAITRLLSHEELPEEEWLTDARMLVAFAQNLDLRDRFEVFTSDEVISAEGRVMREEFFVSSSHARVARHFLARAEHPSQVVIRNLSQERAALLTDYRLVYDERTQEPLLLVFTEWRQIHSALLDLFDAVRAALWRLRARRYRVTERHALWTEHRCFVMHARGGSIEPGFIIPYEDLQAVADRIASRL